MAKVLTAKSVEAIKADPARRLEIPDAAMSGLYLVVQPSAARSWAYRYRFEGKPRKLTLGRSPALSLADAREKAREAARAVELGKDPNEAKADAKAEARVSRETERDKVKTLVEQFDRRHLSGLKSGAQARAFLDRFVVAAWGDRDVHTISKRDVIDLLDGIVDRGTPVTANRVLAHARKFFNWTVERDILAVAPTTGVKAPARETSRSRVLSDDEIRWFWLATGAEGQPFGPLARVLLLTAQRLGEVVGMTDREIRDGVWRLAPDRTKNARAHDVPLSEAVVDTLAGIKRIRGAKGLIFTTTGETPVSGFDRGIRRLRARMEAIASEERGEAIQIPPWGFHDLRRTAATNMARLGVAVRVTEAALNHVSGTGGGIVAVYQRHNYADEKRAALDAWARYVLDLTGTEKTDNVVALGTAR